MDEPQTLILEPGSEWRFELEADENISVRVRPDTTDSNRQVQSNDPVYINGEELPPVTWYPLFKYLKGAIYSPGDARLEGWSGVGSADGSFGAPGVAVHFWVHDAAALEQPAPCARAVADSCTERGFGGTAGDGCWPAVVGKDDGDEESGEHGAGDGNGVERRGGRIGSRKCE